LSFSRQHIFAGETLTENYRNRHRSTPVLEIANGEILVPVECVVDLASEIGSGATSVGRCDVQLARVLEVPGAMSRGRTREEARENVQAPGSEREHPRFTAAA
jgi:hypothetical protein